MNAKQDELERAVAAASPQLIDAWEATALIESFGYTDHAIKQEFGLANTLALGSRIYERFGSEVPRQNSKQFPHRSRWQRVARGIGNSAKTFSSSFIYSLPWIVLFVLQSAWPQALEMPPELAGPLGLALMASLITSGGFIQVIARRGQFYMGVKEPALARRICWYFLSLGFTTTVILSAVGLFLGLYFMSFPHWSLLIAVLYYVMLSLLWMVCAVLSIQKHSWRIPATLFLSIVVFVLSKFALGVEALMAQIIATFAALGLAGGLAVFGFGLHKGSSELKEMHLPRIPVLLRSLAPYFCYGTAYFSFLFADRISAGSAIPPLSGLIFGIDSEYELGINLALLSFLTITALIECLNERFMSYWKDQAAVVTQREIATLSRRLRRRYLLFIVSVTFLFTSVGGAVWLAFSNLRPAALSPSVVKTMLISDAGYLFLSVGLFNAVVLFSLDQPVPVLRALLPGLMLNLILGYSLSNMIDVHYAVSGLVVGAAVFALGSGRAVLKALSESDYAYYAG